jgi:hypothetical protein
MTLQPPLFDEHPKRKEHDNWDQVIEAISIQKDIPGNRLLDLVPQAALLALTRQYGVQSIHISKILNYLSKRSAERQGIVREEISSELAITWARTQGTLNVIRKIGLITPHNKLTKFGQLVLSTCPYIDNPGLLWLFHYILGSNANLVIWSHLFNGVFYKKEEISILDITQDFSILSGRWSENSLKEKVPGEAGGIIKGYTEGFLKPLNLLSRLDLGKYACASNTQIIPGLVWLSAILIYRDLYYPSAPSLEIPLIIDANFSPGRIFRQNQMSVRKSLDEMHNVGLLTVETRSGLDQVRFKRETTWLSAIAHYLEGGTP